VPTAYPDEFRRDVVNAARASDASMASIARDFGISESCLARWLKLADRDDGIGDRPGGQRSDGSSVSSAVTPAAAASAEQRLRELEKRNKQLEQENEVLRRATAYFARDVLPK
jgi:transposase